VRIRRSIRTVLGHRAGRWRRRRLTRRPQFAGLEALVPQGGDTDSQLGGWLRHPIGAVKTQLSAVEEREGQE
jgi:hypothetical protein